MIVLWEWTVAARLDEQLERVKIFNPKSTDAVACHNCHYLEGIKQPLSSQTFK